jgi:hypothetical protein
MLHLVVCLDTEYHHPLPSPSRVTVSPTWDQPIIPFHHPSRYRIMQKMGGPGINQSHKNM